MSVYFVYGMSQYNFNFEYVKCILVFNILLLQSQPESPSSPLPYSGDRAALTVINAEDNFSRQLRRASKWQPPHGAWITKGTDCFIRIYLFDPAF